MEIEVASLVRDKEAFFLYLGTEENNHTLEYTFLYSDLTEDNSFEVFFELNEIINSCIGRPFTINWFERLDELKEKNKLKKEGK